MNTNQTQEETLLRIIKGSRDGLWDWNLRTNEVFFTPQSYELMDIPNRTQSVTFDTILKRIMPEDVASTQANMKDLIENGTPYQVEHHIQLKDGVMRYCLCRGSVTECDSTGKPVMISGTITDITHLKHMEQALQQTQDRLDRAISGSDEGFWEWDVVNDSLYWSDRMFEMLGLPKIDGPLDYHFFETFLPEEEKPRIKAAIAKTLQEGIPIFEEYRMQHVSGNYLYVHAKAKPYYNEKGQIIRLSGMMADITKQKQQELLLKESEERFRTMAEASPMMIWMTDENLQITYTNTTYREFMGRNDLENVPWTSYIHPEDLPKLLDAADSMLEHPSPEKHELRLRRADGSYRWIYTIRAPRWDDAGHFMGYIGSNVDITQLKLAEQAIKEYASRLERSNQELDQFVLIASHDLQEPLRKLALFSGFIKESAGEKLPLECMDYMARMQQAVTRMQTLLDDLLTLSRITRKGKPPLPTNLGEVLQGVLAALEVKRRSVEGTITVGNTLTIDADENQMYQVFYNLLDNALKFHRKEVPPVIEVDMREVGDNICEITVTDNGIGFEEKYLDRIFQIFERLHGRTDYEGSGIGLAIAQKIVARHKGSITARSEPGKGSTFIVRLPIHDAIHI